jgi:hypothetical protein
MGKIKSALEIALERTETVKGDKSSIDQFEAKQQGKRLANAFLEDGAGFADELKKAPPDRQKSLKQGIFEVLISQISLPVTQEDVKRVEAAGNGLQAVIGDSRFAAICKQLSRALSQYMDEAAHYDQAIHQQYAPKLRQKEEELSRRMGREVRVDPFQDPEFVSFYNQNMNALRGNYQTAVDQVKEEARRLFGDEKSGRKSAG